MNKIINILLVLTVILLGAGVASAFDEQFVETHGINAFTVRTYPNTGQPNVDFDESVINSGQSLTFGVGTYYYIISKTGYVATQEGSFSGAGTQTFSLYPTPGGVITWDKSSYNKGETATITVTYNPTNFNRSQFYYELYVIDPVTFENVVFHEVISSTYTTSFVMTNEGNYQAYAYVGLASNHNTGVESVNSNRLSAGSTISSFVTWNLHNVGVGHDGSMSWGISPSIWDSFNTYSVRLYRGTALVQTFDNLDNFGTVQYAFTSAGTYSTKLISTPLIGSETILATDPIGVNVINPLSYLTVNQTVFAGLAFNATYKFGSTPLQQGELNSVAIEQLTNMGYVPLSTTSLGNNNIVGGTSYNVSLIVAAPGQYRLKLYDSSVGYVATATTTAVSAFIPPVASIITSRINVSKSTYFFGEQVLADYQFSSSDFQYQKYFRVRSVAYNESTIDNQVLYEQIDSFQLPISAGIPDISGCSNCFLATPGRSWHVGSYSIELHIKNSTIDNIVAYANFTVNPVNVDGYGLDLKNSNVCEGGIITLVMSAPVGGSANVTVYLRQPTATYQEQIVYKQYYITSQNTSTQLKLAFKGDYELEMTGTGATQFIRYVHVGSCVATAPGVTVPAGATDQIQASQAAIDLTSLISSKLFWTLVLICGLMLAVAMKERRGN